VATPTAKDPPAGTETAEEAPKVETGSYGPLAPPLDELRLSHRVLLTEYVGVLAEITVPMGWRCGRFARILTAPRMVRRFVHSHIRRKMKEVTQAYVELEQTLPDDPTIAEYADWLNATRKQLERLRDSLSSWRLPGLITLGSFAVTVAGAAAKVKLHGSFFATNRSLIGFIFGYVAFIILWLLGFVYQSFRYKRDLFLGRRRTHASTAIGGDHNVYRLETALFALLNRGRRREGAVDYAVLNLTGYGVLLMLALAPVAFDFPLAGAYVLVLVLAYAVVLVLSFWYLRLEHRREWS
jgi:hypothetical protein